MTRGLAHISGLFLLLFSFLVLCFLFLGGTLFLLQPALSLPLRVIPRRIRLQITPILPRLLATSLLLPAILPAILRVLAVLLPALRGIGSPPPQSHKVL